MAVTIKEVFDRQFDQTRFDIEFCKRVINYSVKYMNRNDDHSAFFGGVLLGVNPIRFLNSDREEWYDSVLDVDEDLLVADFKKVTSVNHEFNVMSDVFNYTPAYVMHRLLHATNVNANVRKEAMIHAFMVLHYRFITSLLVKRFKYPADPAVAQATYAALNGRFDIKRYGSWRALLYARGEDLSSPSSIYYRTIEAFNPDPMLIRVVTDTQGRIRGVIKKIYAIHKQFSDEGNRIRTTTDTMIGNEGEIVLKDKTNQYADYLRYIKETVQTERNFIRDELVKVITNVMPTMPPEPFVECLRYLSNQYGKPKSEYLDGILQEMLLFTFEFLQSNREVLGRQLKLDLLLVKLRALLMASRSSDPTVLKLRVDTEQMVQHALVHQRVRSFEVPALRTGVLLYIVLRSLTQNYYKR